MRHHLTAQDIRYGYRTGKTPWDLCASRSYNTEIRVGLWDMVANFPVFPTRKGKRKDRKRTPPVTAERIHKYLDTGFVEEHTWSDDPDDWWRIGYEEHEPEAEGLEGPTAREDEDLEAVWTHPG